MTEAARLGVRRACRTGSPQARRALLGLGMLSLAAVGLSHCGPADSKRVERPSAGPRLVRPIEVIPPDLQLVVRVSVQRLRQSVGQHNLANIEEQSRLAPLAEPLLSWALERADTAWVALRLGLSPDETDNVVVVTGDFADLQPPRQEWAIPDDLGAGWQRWDRREKVARSLPSRLYALAGETVVFVSEAEIDPVTRTLERGVRPELVEPPEQGLVSLAASMPALAQAVRADAPQAANLLAKGRAVTGYADFEHGRGLRATLDFDFGDARQAERSTRALELLLASLSAGSGPLAALHEHLRVEAIKESVSVRLELSQALLAGWLTASRRR